MLQVNFIGAIEFDKKRIWFLRGAVRVARSLFLTHRRRDGRCSSRSATTRISSSASAASIRASARRRCRSRARAGSRSACSTRRSTRIRVEGYFAVTSNTVQFGARVELFFGLDELQRQGPPRASTRCSSSRPSTSSSRSRRRFSVNVFGVGLFSVRVAARSKGPAPWHIEGHGSISLLFFDIDVDFDETWGESRDTTLPPIAVMPLLEAEIDKAENWRALLPAGANLLVSLRKMPSRRSALVLHPVGVLHVSQRALPLELKLDKVGNQKPSDVNRLSVAVTGGGLAQEERRVRAVRAGAVPELLATPTSCRSRPSAASAAGSSCRRRPAAALERAWSSASCATRRSSSTPTYKRFARRFRGFFGVAVRVLPQRRRRQPLASSRRRRRRSCSRSTTRSPSSPRRTPWRSRRTTRLSPPKPVAFHSEASAREYIEPADRRRTPTLADALHVIPELREGRMSHARHLLVPAVAAAGARQPDHGRRLRPAVQGARRGQRASSS